MKTAAAVFNKKVLTAAVENTATVGTVYHHQCFAKPAHSTNQSTSMRKIFAHVILTYMYVTILVIVTLPNSVKAESSATFKIEQPFPTPYYNDTFNMTCKVSSKLEVGLSSIPCVARDTLLYVFHLPYASLFIFFPTPLHPSRFFPLLPLHFPKIDLFLRALLRTAEVMLKCPAVALVQFLKVTFSD